MLFVKQDLARDAFHVSVPPYIHLSTGASEHLLTTVAHVQKVYSFHGMKRDIKMSSMLIVCTIA